MYNICFILEMWRRIRTRNILPAKSHAYSKLSVLLFSVCSWWSSSSDFNVDFICQDPDSLPIVEWWDSYLNDRFCNEPEDDYITVINDLVLDFDADEVARMYAAYPDSLDHMCDLYRPHLPFSDQTIQEIAEAVFQHLFAIEKIDNAEILQVPILINEVAGFFSPPFFRGLARFFLAKKFENFKWYSL